MLEHRLPGAGLLPRRAASCGHRDSREALQRVEDLTDFIQHSVLAAFSNSSTTDQKEKEACTDESPYNNLYMDGNCQMSIGLPVWNHSINIKI